MARRQNRTAWLVGIFGIIFVVAIFLVAGGQLQTAFQGLLGVEVSPAPEAGEFAYSYIGKNVELKLQASNKYTASSIDPTYYVYDEQPSEWGSGRVSVQDGYISSYTSSSGEAVLVETPGTYYVRAVVSGYYDDFLTVEVPAGGDVTLSEYNDGGEDIVKIQMIDVETLSTSNLDMGITTNETSDKTYHVFANFNVDDNEGFRLDEVIFREDSTYAFATDTDADGIYDEGINKIDFIIDGERTTLFSVSASVDEFSGDDEAKIDIASDGNEYKEYPENGVVSFKFEVTCDQTLDTTGDGDEKCGNGEDFLDDVILVDSAGNTATFELNG